MRCRHGGARWVLIARSIAKIVLLCVTRMEYYTQVLYKYQGIYIVIYLLFGR